MLRVEVADRSADFATVGSLGGGVPTARAAAAQRRPAGLARPVARESSRAAISTRRRPTIPRRTWAYTETLVERARPMNSRILPVAGTLALEALRIAAWRPRAATEVDATTIPHELDWLRSAVHLSKGCYRGQETVAKVHNLGHPPRRLVMLHLDGSDGVLPAPGSAVSAPATPRSGA